MPHDVCYFPDGTVVGDIPCNQTAVNAGGHSPCCNIDAWCMDNGLCFGKGIVSRGSCTDNNWGSDCAQYCYGDNDNPGGGIPITPCDPIEPTFACGSNLQGLCDGATFNMNGGTDFLLRGYQAAPLEPSGSSVAMSLDPTATVFPYSASKSGSAGSRSNGGVTTVTAHPDSSADQGYTTGEVAAAAAGAGGPLLLTLIAALIVIFNLRRKLRQARKQQEAAEATAREKPPGHHNYPYSPGSAPGYTSPASGMYNSAAPGYFSMHDQPRVSRDNSYATAPQHGYGHMYREMPEDSGVRELGTDQGLSELDTRSGTPGDPEQLQKK